MRTFMRNQRGKIDVLLGFVIVVIAVGFAIYEFWVKEHAVPTPDSQSQPKTVIDGVRDKVNDAMEKQMSRIPVDEPTQPGQTR
jgi:hypothetical protein